MDLNQVKSLFTATDFERGMEYYRKGRVTDMQCTKAGPETNVSCTVRGSKRYTVRFTEMAEGRLRISCTCPRYADVGRCKHLAAAMIAYIGEPPHESVPGSDSCARWMLQRYLQITQESIEPSQQPVRLRAMLRAGYGAEYPSFSLRVGYDRLYSVQNIREFLDNVSQRRTVVYGKGLTLEHNLELFEPKAQAMIRLLMNEYGRYRALGSSSYYMGYEPPDYRKNEITLTGDSFDRGFDLLSDAPVDCAGSEPLTLTQTDPQVRLQIAEEGGGAWLTVIRARRRQASTLLGRVSGKDLPAARSKAADHVSGAEGSSDLLRLRVAGARRTGRDRRSAESFTKLHPRFLHGLLLF